MSVHLIIQAALLRLPPPHFDFKASLRPFFSRPIKSTFRAENSLKSEL